MTSPETPIPIDDPYLAEMETPAERQRRQRCFRLLAISIAILLFLANDEPPPRNNNESQKVRGNSSNNNNAKNEKKAVGKEYLKKSVWQARRREDVLLGRAFNETDNISGGVQGGEVLNEDRETVLLNYPRNAAGYYRGLWSEKDFDIKRSILWGQKGLVVDSEGNGGGDDDVRSRLRVDDGNVGVYLLPPATLMEANNHNYDSVRVYDDKESVNVASGAEVVNLSSKRGIVAMQIYQKSVMGMSEMSLIDGLIRIYEGNTPTLLLQAKGVMIHQLGKLSLVANADIGRSGFLINPEKSIDSISLAHDHGGTNVNDPNGDTEYSDENVIGDAEGDNPDSNSKEKDEDQDEASGRRLLMETTLDKLIQSDSPIEQDGLLVELRKMALLSSLTNETIGDEFFQNAHREVQRRLDDDTSHLLISYPYVPDDGLDSLQNNFLQSRPTIFGEQYHEKRANRCEFEITLNALPIHTDMNTFQTLRTQRSKIVASAFPNDSATNTTATTPKTGSAADTTTSTNANETSTIEEALVTIFKGEITSPNCQIAMNITAAPLRTDWKSVASKAINYSYYMMLACLIQFVVLCYQFLHTRAASAATRVSLLCVGWQAFLDVALCMWHFSLSLVMQPLFTAFASAGFFNFLVFSIEIRYAAIIAMARNENSARTTKCDGFILSLIILWYFFAGRNHLSFFITAVIITWFGAACFVKYCVALFLVSVRFGAALVLVFISYWYFGQHHIFVFMTISYSYWVPQIVYNVVTEAKQPMHTHYIYGMSLTRLAMPLYVYCVKNNFVREMWPDFPRALFFSQVLVLWVGLQTGILILQGKYGARFMIPARFLPPKSHSGQPTPPSLLPLPHTKTPTPSPTVDSMVVAMAVRGV